jgi:two-component system sensor histidine kinase VanS
LELVKLSGEMPAPKKETIQILHCVTGVLESLSPLMESKEQLLTVDVPDDISCELNDGLFTKALSNIILNAAQNSPNGSEIRIAANEEEGHVCLTIWNGDIQIPEDILLKLCEPFFRADEAHTSGEGRSGLGLTIVKKTLDLMGIPFTLKNIDGGVMFRMDIPKD